MVAIGYLAVSFNVVDAEQMESAATAYPEVHNGVQMIFAGQIFAGIGAIAGALVIYFRQKATKRIA